MVDLSTIIAGWQPEAVEATDRIAQWPVAAFSAALDLPGAVAGPGDPLPPLWHWFSFLAHRRRSELGADGHPAAGHFLPPIPDRRRMIAGGRWRMHEPMLVGDEITRRSELLDVKVKTGRSGEMAFVTLRHDFSRRGTHLATEEQDVVYRSQPAGQQRTLPAGNGTAEPTSHRWRIQTPTDPTLLFQFSALTYNTHRIHYDEPYATGAERYPGLVVHGPLLALLLLEIPRRNLPDRSVTAFEYRLSRPVFCGDLVVAGGSPDGPSALALSACVPGAADAINGRAELAPR